MDKLKHKMYAVKLNVEHDFDIIERLDAEENKQAFIKHCIRREIVHDRINKDKERDRQS